MERVRYRITNIPVAPSVLHRRIGVRLARGRRSTVAPNPGGTRLGEPESLEHQTMERDSLEEQQNRSIGRSIDGSMDRCDSYRQPCGMPTK